MTLDGMIFVLDIAGIFVFAISGALAARQRQLDIFGGIVLALVTAVGGGTFRDLVLGVKPVFWVSEPVYVAVAGSAALFTFAVARRYVFPRRTLLVADAIGLAVFTLMGVQKALAYQVSPLIAIMLGVVTGVGGGLIRDVIVNEVPLILRREIYATAAFAGGLLFILLIAIGVMPRIATICGVLLVFTLRLAAIRWRWALPLHPAEGPEERR